MLSQEGKSKRKRLFNLYFLLIPRNKITFLFICRCKQCKDFSWLVAHGTVEKPLPSSEVTNNNNNVDSRINKGDGYIGGKK